MDKEMQKKEAAYQAIHFVEDDMIVGVGSGSTVRYFIEALGTVKHRLQGAVATSLETEALLKSQGIRVLDLNSVGTLPLYVDGADEINAHKQMIKGGGGALTREKIVAACSKQFVCIIDPSKKVEVLGKFPLAIEVIPMARSYVAREIVKLGGDPVYREGFVTDNHNSILDVYNLKLINPIQMEIDLNNITGIVCHGLFAKRGADRVLCA